MCDGAPIFIICAPVSWEGPSFQPTLLALATILDCMHRPACRPILMNFQGDPRRRPRLTRRVQSEHIYNVSAVATGADAESDAAKEIYLLRSLCHPNIVRLIEVIGTASAVSYLILVVALGPLYGIYQHAHECQNSCGVLRRWCPHACLPRASLITPINEPLPWCFGHWT